MSFTQHCLVQIMTTVTKLVICALPPSPAPIQAILGRHGPLRHLNFQVYIQPMWRQIPSPLSSCNQLKMSNNDSLDQTFYLVCLNLLRCQDKKEKLSVQSSGRYRNVTLSCALHTFFVEHLTNTTKYTYLVTILFTQLLDYFITLSTRLVLNVFN